VQIKVLAVEDSPDYAALISTWLSSKSRNISFELVMTSSLVSAKQHLASDTYDVAIIDLSLVDSAGIEVLRSLLLERPAIPLVVLSATEDEHTVEGSIWLGAADFIGKSVCTRDMLILTLLQSIVRHYEAESEQDTRIQAAMPSS
jgi:two-component system, cell cycle response regulator